MTPQEALKILEEKFSSGNEIKVERATITREEFEALKREIARLDTLSSRSVFGHY